LLSADDKVAVGSCVTVAVKVSQQRRNLAGCDWEITLLRSKEGSVRAVVDGELDPAALHDAELGQPDPGELVEELGALGNREGTP